VSFVLPLGDPQFWVVSVAALAALAFFVRRKFRFKRKGEIDLPCDNCPQSKAHSQRNR
jgi:hypothetical protein